MSFPFPFKITAYADDLAISVTVRNRTLVLLRVQEISNILVDNLKEVLLEVNEKKCVLMFFFGRKDKLCPDHNITINNGPN